MWITQHFDCINDNKNIVDAYLLCDSHMTDKGLGVT